MSHYPARLLAIDTLQTRIDYNSSTIQYIGLAPPNAKLSEAKWQIKRITLDSSGRTTQIEFAGLTAEFDQIWNNRTLANYSP